MSGPIAITAAVLHEARSALVCEPLMLAPPRADEVLVKVAAAGVCHSDLHLAEGHLGEGRWPIVLGHEGAGIVEAVGERVTHVAPGDPVAFCFVPPCRACAACRAGRFHLCTTAAANAWRGTLLDGTSRLSFADGRSVQHFNFVSCFADRCVVPAASAIPLSAPLPLWQAALLGCGVVTGRAVRNTARVRVGETVCVIGCGGVGLQVIAGARLAGAGRIIAVDRSAEKLERAARRGATDTVDGSQVEVVAAVLELVPGGVDYAFEVVGLPGTIRQAWDVIRPGRLGDRGRARAQGRRGVAAGARPAQREEPAGLLLRVGQRRRRAAGADAAGRRRPPIEGEVVSHVIELVPDQRGVRPPASRRGRSLGDRDRSEAAGVSAGHVL